MNVRAGKTGVLSKFGTEGVNTRAVKTGVLSKLGKILKCIGECKTY